MSDKKTHNIYMLDTEKLTNLGKSINEQITRIIEQSNGNSRYKYKLQDLKDETDFQGFSIKLYYRNEEKDSRIKLFCESFVKENQEVVRSFTRSSSSIMFIWNKKSIYAVTTGQGFRAIEEYCMQKFGLLVISAFNAFKITALDSNTLSSIVHSSKTIYSNEVDFIDVTELDTIYKEITGRLNDIGIVKKIINNDETKKSSIKVIGKNYIQFSNSMNLNDLLHLLSLLNAYNYNQISDSFNLISPIDNKTCKSIIDRNNKAVIEKMFDAIKKGDTFCFDLFHKNTNDFITATEYIVENKKRDLISEEEIRPWEFIKNAYDAYLDGKDYDYNSFESFIYSSKIIAKNEERVITSEKILNHISGEIEINGHSYFVFYGNYYSITQSYTERLNESLTQKLSIERTTDKIKTLWKKDDKEDDFNRNASNNEGYIHIHKVKPDYIEFADLIKQEGNDMYIVHVKDGFDDDMRALDRQVELSIHKLMDLRNKNNSKFMKKLYENAKKNKEARNITEDFKTEESFIKAMKECDIHYIIAIRPPKKNLLENKSNIAKHCLNALILRCYNQGIDLKINII